MSEPVLSDRGFKHYSPIPSEYGGFVRVYESSAARAPHVWVAVECPANLNDPRGRQIEAYAHLTLANATALRDALSHLIANHYRTPTPVPAAARDTNRPEGHA